MHGRDTRVGWKVGKNASSDLIKWSMDLINKPFWITFDCKRSKIMFVHRGHGGKWSSSQALKKIMIHFRRWGVLFSVLLHRFKGPSTRKEPKPTPNCLYFLLFWSLIGLHFTCWDLAEDTGLSLLLAFKWGLYSD